MILVESDADLDQKLTSCCLIGVSVTIRGRDTLFLHETVPSKNSFPIIFAD